MLSRVSTRARAHTHTCACAHMQAKELGRCPWSLSFSFGRALQHSALQLWAKDHGKAEEAKKLALAVAAVRGCGAPAVRSPAMCAYFAVLPPACFVHHQDTAPVHERPQARLVLPCGRHSRFEQLFMTEAVEQFCHDSQLAVVSMASGQANTGLRLWQNLGMRLHVLLLRLMPYPACLPFCAACWRVHMEAGVHLRQHPGVHMEAGVHLRQHCGGEQSTLAVPTAWCCGSWAAGVNAAHVQRVRVLNSGKAVTLGATGWMRAMRLRC